MIGYLVAVAISQSAPAAPSAATDFERMSDEQFCSLMKGSAERLTPDLPIMLDKVTRLEGLSAVCGYRTISWNKSSLTDQASLAEGWDERRLKQFNESVCSNPLFAPMVRRGWRFVEYVTFPDGKRVTFDATCR
jgi:hypothetical protein